MNSPRLPLNYLNGYRQALLILKEKINPDLICLAIKYNTTPPPLPPSLPSPLSSLPSSLSPTNHNKLTWSGGPVRNIICLFRPKGFSLCISP